MPMIHVLLEQIGETPPNDFLVNAQMKAQKKEFQRKQDEGFAELKGRIRKRKA